MTKPRFFIEGRHAPGDVVALGSSDARKAQTVLRMRPGDSLEIIDSAGQQFDASFESNGRSALARLRELVAGAAAPEVAIDVAQAIPKGQKMDFVVEKLTELGVARILPIETERTIAGAATNKLERWRRLAKTAAQQCGRTGVPQIAASQTLEALAGRFSSYDCVLFAWELAEHRALRDTLPDAVAGASSILLVIGPEGGFSHEEAVLAQQAGAKSISLGSRILRTETAALAVVSVLNYLTEG